MNQQSSPSTASLPTFALLAVILLGTAGGAMFGLADTALRGVGLSMADGAFAVAMWIGVAAAGSIPIALLTALGVKLLSLAFDRRTFVCLLIALLLQALLVVFLTPVLAIAALWIPALIALLARRYQRLAQGKSLAFGCLVLIATSGLLACTLAALDTAARNDTPRQVSSARLAGGGPNVVLIVLDTQRADYLGCYSETRNLTPNIDRIAAEGTLYEQAFATSSWTVPSHASLFTGLYPVTHGASFQHHRWLDDRFTTLAETLGAQGYQTVALVANHYLDEANLLQGFETKKVLAGSYDNLLIYRLTQTVGFPGKWADQGAAEAVEELHNWLNSDFDPARPFFMFVNLMEAHWRYLPPLQERREHLPKNVGYWQATRLSTDFYGVDAMVRPPETAQLDQTTETIRALYAAEVAYQDRQFGALMAELGSVVDLDSTLLIVTSDHGENLGEAGRWDHVFALNDYLLQVPLIVRYPTRFPASTRMDGLCQLTDVLPTILDVLDDSAGTNIPNHTLVPTQFERRTAIFAQVAPYYGHLERMSELAGMQNDIADFTASLLAVRNRDFKYVSASNGSNHLFQINNDPHEKVNVTQTFPALAETMDSQLLQWYERQSHYIRPVRPAHATSSKRIDPNTKQRLKSLGYLR